MRVKCILFGVGILIAILGVVLLGNYRLYTNMPTGWVVMKKYGFSFKDTFVNLENLEGMPRIALATMHPQVKRQLEAAGVYKTDKEVTNEFMDKIQRELTQYDQEMNRAYRDSH